MLCIGRVSPGKLAASFQTPAGIHASCARRSLVLRLGSAAPIPAAACLTSLSLFDRKDAAIKKKNKLIYERSQAIEQRLETVLRLIRTGRYSTPAIAEEVGVSIPTVSRCINALRDRGHDISGRFRGTMHCHGKLLRRELVVALRSLNCLS